LTATLERQLATVSTHPGSGGNVVQAGRRLAFPKGAFCHGKIRDPPAGLTEQVVLCEIDAESNGAIN